MRGRPSLAQNQAGIQNLPTVASLFVEVENKYVSYTRILGAEMMFTKHLGVVLP